MSISEFHRILFYKCNNCKKVTTIFNNRKEPGPPLIMCPICEKPYSKKQKTGPIVLKQPDATCAFTFRNMTEKEAIQMATQQITIHRKMYGFNIPEKDTEEYMDLVIHVTQRILEDKYPMIYKNTGVKE